MQKNLLQLTDSQAPGVLHGGECSCKGHSTISPTLPRSDKPPKFRVYPHPRTLSDIADDAARDRVCSDPDSLFEAFLADRATGVLHC